jgi:hypothetical protein
LFTAQHVSGVFPLHHQELNDCSGSLWFYLLIVVTVVLCSWSGWPAGRPDHKHSTTVTTMVVVIYLNLVVIYLNCTIMHGLKNLEVYI